jgi:hypothetical protein
MSDRKIINRIKNSTERILPGFITGEGEFIFNHTQGGVPAGTRYAIYYTLDKSEQFIAEDDRLLLPIEPRTVYGRYAEVKSLTRENYPEEFRPTPTKNDYDRGTVKRYFARKANDIKAPIFEIDEQDAGDTGLFITTSFDWIISGEKLEAIVSNLQTMIFHNEILPGIHKILTPLEYWKPSKGSRDSVLNKLEFVTDL